MSKQVQPPVSMPEAGTRQTMPAQTAVRFEYSPDFPGILAHLKASLVVSTYQAGKLAVIGVDSGRLEFSFHELEQPMGVAVSRDAIALGSRRDIHVLRAAHDIAPGILPEQTFDAAWLTRHSFRTGNIHGHELAWGRDGLWVVNTLFSTLCTLQDDYSFVPRWRPPFITELKPNDRCHLNGLAMQDGRPKYVTAHGQSNEPGGWRAARATGGIVMDVDSGEIVARGFAMPHSPRLAHERLWVLNSGAGQLGTIDVTSGRFEPVVAFPGYTRGLAFHGQFAFVGLSKIRERSVFGGLPIEQDRANLRCGVAVFDFASGKTVATLQFHSGVDELFAVSVLPECLLPCIVGPHDTESNRADIWVLPASAAAPEQLTNQERTASFKTLPKDDTTVPAHSSPPTRVDQLVVMAEELQRQDRLTEALAAYQSAIDAAPERASLHCNLGNLWQQLDDQHQAIACYQRALQVEPDCVPARQNLGYLLFNHGRTEEAIEQYDSLVRLSPTPINRLLSACALPVVYDSAESLESSRQRMVKLLDDLIADEAKIDTTNTLVPTWFFLAYQGMNDVEIMRRLGRICQGPEVVPPIRGPLRPRSDGRLRVGFLSAYFRDHTIGRLNLGRIQHLDRTKFEVTVLAATGRQDDLTSAFRSAADRYCTLPRDVETARQTIVDQDLDVLVFADVGMDSLTSTLAWSRMAPVQCATWGHPETTGSSHMDYFLSSDLLEIPDADTHYSERLVRLPLLATYFERPILTLDDLTQDRAAGAIAAPITRKHRNAIAADLGLTSANRRYVCPQTLFKAHPDFDCLLSGILSADPQAEIVLIEGRVQHWTNCLQRRFERTLPEGCRRVRIIPAMPREAFLKLLACADVVLDTPHFGGGHSSYEALAVGTPVVTWPRDFLRSRITQALYKKMNSDQLIVSDEQSYIALATKLANKDSYRNRVSRRILNACSILFEDPAEVRGLDDWLWSLTIPQSNARADEILVD